MTTKQQDDAGGGGSIASNSSSSGDVKKREVWSSRTAFYFAAVGAAVGFGNVWRFPSLSVEYGGGAFFVPYLMALFLIGIPLAILEIGFGQYFQTGDVGVFGGFHPRLRGVGLSSIACGFMLVSYYSVLLAWVVHAFVDSFTDNHPWNDPNLDSGMAVGYFVNDIIGAGTLPYSTSSATRMVPANVGYSALVWTFLYLCTAWGVKWTGRITYLTMGLPIVMLFLLLIRGCTLPGASEGIRQYIGIWDMSILRTQGEVWSVACSQIFFSIGLTFGILTAYGSHCPRNEPAVTNSFVISLANSMFSIIAGFAVFAALGHLAYENGTEVTELDIGGFSLVFGTWPVVLSTLPGGIHWIRLLFVMLFLLGVDSAFAFLEAYTTVLHDTVYFKDVKKPILLLFPVISNFLFSLMYCTDAGLNWLDIIDFYINFVMLLVGFFESFGAAWAYEITDEFDIIGKPAVWAYMGTNFIPVGIACAIWFGTDTEHRVWAGFVALVGLFMIGIVVTHVFLKKRMTQDTSKQWTMRSIWWECIFGNILRLRDRISPVIGKIPFLWILLMKQFIPHVLIILFINLATSGNAIGEYGGYPMRPYQALGICTFVFALALVAAGLTFPKLYAPLAMPQVDDTEDDEPDKEVSELKKVDDDDDGDDDSDDAKKPDDIGETEIPVDPDEKNDGEA